jgi:serine/threonine protein kinase
MSYSPVATQRARARVGTLLNEKWRLDSLLGIGGMAAVYGATHRNGKRAALKMLHGELVADPALVARFLREGYLANKVEHQGVVSVLDDSYAEDGAPYLVMELLEGYSLERHTQSPANALPLRQVLKIADELLDVLAAAHAKGIVHRDIKPANLFLTRDGKLKVLDFGIARLAETSAEGGLTQTGAAIGTPSYMPPEQARGRWMEVDARTDLWAVGATMLALLLGHRPRRADTVQEELFVAMTAPMPSVATLCPDVTERVGRAIDCAVAFERERRFPDAHAMQLELRRASDADAVAVDRTLVVSAMGDTAPVMHPGMAQPPSGQDAAAMAASSPITSPSNASRSHASGAHASPSYGSTVQMSEPQLTTGRPMWVAPPPPAAAPSRGGAGGAIVAAVAVVGVALAIGGAFAWKKHRAGEHISDPSAVAARPEAAPSAPSASPPSLPALDPPVVPVAPAPSSPADAPTAPDVASAAPASSTTPAASHASTGTLRAPLAPVGPRGSATPRSPGAGPPDNAGMFDRRF